MFKPWMRLICVLGLSALGACGSCNGGSGVSGSRCASWPARYCDDPGDTCIDGICRGCGGLGEFCCGGDRCDGDATCVPQPGGDRICQDCGALGEACCTGSLTDFCQEDNYCDMSTDTCIARPTSGCTGSERFIFYADLGFGCGDPAPIPIFGDSESAAESCGEMTLGIPLRDEAPESFTYCNTPPRHTGDSMEVTFYAFDEEDDECAEALCTNCVSRVEGECP